MATENPFHIDPLKVIELAQKPEIIATAANGTSILEGALLGNGTNVYLIRRFHENVAHQSVQIPLKEITGCTAEEIHQLIETLAPYDKNKLRATGSVFVGRGGDSLILDPGMREKNVEFMVVGQITLPEGRHAEFAFVRMWAYGALKQLQLPSGNPGNQIEWEMALSFNGNLCFVVPEAVEDREGRIVTSGEGIKFELQTGDAIFLPLIPRQVISTNIEAAQANNLGAKYLTISPQWGGDLGASQKPIYWKDQIEFTGQS